MRGLALLTTYHGLSASSARTFYSGVQRIKLTEHQQNTVLEQLLFALHQCSALRAMLDVQNKADIARVGIVAWYYGIYAAASAMVTAQDGSFQDDHTGTAVQWSGQIAQRDLVMPPFEMRVSTLVRKDADLELMKMLTVEKRSLSSAAPVNRDEAEAAVHAYLSGCVKWWRWKTEESIRDSRDFRDLKVADFRTAAARELRDRRLAVRNVSFLHEAIRYRGKANYRDAVFLGYGTTVPSQLDGYIADLSSVLTGFVTMAGSFCARRLGPTVWDEFVADLEAKRSFTTAPSQIWS
ncbi:hypothetical protein ASF60_13040 [Methylobacterium sp. Leaf113]|uniref:hypothetical protein n=1 Tax=Methylobacterium sp. Leaf113 TaxID=1736259 RepID=UPI0006FA8B29|nr:hypothetical protein [Methylobacterium sp. Leaf113]KQP94362.1 hypothetical protein ASF60_13040 [Methylobacterium sp. Leaf113]